MNIKDIVDKIPKEADINPAEYTVPDRLVDVNSIARQLREKSIQIGSKEPMSNEEPISETFTIVQGSNTLTRTIKDSPIFRVDFKATGATRWCRLDLDESRGINTWCGCEITFFANEKQVFVENGRAGDIRITYVMGSIADFDMADYLDYNPPSPDWLPEAFHDLLWLYPALDQANYYKKDRVPRLEAKLNNLQTLFNNRYKRNAITTSQIKTDSPPNNR